MQLTKTIYPDSAIFIWWVEIDCGERVNFCVKKIVIRQALFQVVVKSFPLGQSLSTAPFCQCQAPSQADSILKQCSRLGSQSVIGTIGMPDVVA